MGKVTRGGEENACTEKINKKNDPVERDMFVCKCLHPLRVGNMYVHVNNTFCREGVQTFARYCTQYSNKNSGTAKDNDAVCVLFDGLF